MLVITRKKNEMVHIGKEIKVSILNIEGDRVSVGIDAPRSVEILRGEHIAEARRINCEAASTKKMASLEDLGMFIGKTKK